MSDLELSRVFPLRPKELYKAWLDSDIHTAFTGSKAVIDSRIGGHYTAWDGYIRGRIIRLDPFDLIVQSWRTLDYPSTAPDSMLEVHFLSEIGSTRLLLRLEGVPDDLEEDLRTGWVEYYLLPMNDYFSSEED